MQPTTPKVILLAFALIAIFMPHVFAAKYSAPATLTSLNTQAWTAGEKTQALVGSSTVDFAANDIDAQGNVTIPKDSQFLQISENPGSIAAGGMYKTAFTLTNAYGYQVDVMGVYSASASYKHFRAIAVKIGSSYVFTEICDPDSVYTLTNDGDNIVITNNQSSTTYPLVMIRRIF